MANEVGAVYVSVMPTTSGFSREMDRELSGAFDSSATKGESRLTGMLGRVAAAGATILATIGLGKLVKSAVTLGVEYNTLEQSSKAAFTTLLDSAEAAATMQQSIREFAKTSPFPRQAFIQASQQLLAFGFSAEKVVPTLDSIQDAVAAIGGTSEDIANVTDVLARIRSGARLGSNELDQLAQHGINGYAILAEQMGITEQEFRDSIFGNPLKGEQATAGLDALIAGMEVKFGGAADGLKSTFVGAIDRIKGATRDLSSALVAPFVDPDGGGYAVEWANKFADILRGVEGSPAFESLKGKLQDFGATLDPIVNKIAGLLTILLDEGWDGFTSALRDMSKDSPKLAGFLEVLDSLAPIMPALADAFKVIGPALVDALPSLANFVVAVLPVMAELLERIAPVLAGVADTIANFSIPNLALGLDGLADLSWLWDDDKLNAITTDGINGKYGEFLAGLFQFSADWDAGWVGFWGDFAADWDGFTTDVGASTLEAIGWFASIPAQIATALATSGLSLYESGRDMITNFIDGINSMLGPVGDAIGGVMSLVEDFFPHSPALRGPFSGAGWDAIKDAGLAIGTQFGAGLQANGASLDLAMNGMLTVPSFEGSAAGAQTNVQVDVHAKENMSGEAFGRAFADQINFDLRSTT